ncbi:hypothetical protein P9D34_03775 [Bacillus swezeyi]|nr:hypothetical protein [Bacillus swezeyi]MEC1259577.1 hypothetical protein [Bacillus swezeyi]MED2927460.1 hypothetical protein [Bacillus swezeyi]MED2941712.1 hypothetical protein [Bacillus swezeyi]MED2962658.1 hypothetical protein [Bacillus swezeyi]MED3071887.1 hypothetical protein [Bacillus swezeyi]
MDKRPSSSETNSIEESKKVLKQFSHLEFIEFESYDSQWLQVFNAPLEQFSLIDSEPTYSKSVGDSNEAHISWFESSLNFLKEKKEWLILVPNCPLPIWANVKVLNFSKAVEELWQTSESHNFIITDKSSGTLAQIFSVEKNYEIHIAKCDVNTIEQKNP